MSGVIPSPDPDAASDAEEAREEGRVHHLAGKLTRTESLQKSAQGFLIAVRIEAQKIAKGRKTAHAVRLAAELLLEVALKEAGLT